jgi:outer membrane protein TolC
VTQFTKNNLKPSLNVFAQYVGASRLGDLGGAFGQIGRFEFPEYAFGITLTIPLLNRSAQADDVRAKLELRQSETELQRTRNQIRLEVRNALIGVTQARAQAESARKALDLSRQTLDAEQRKLQAGISIPYNVIQVQRDFEQAQFAEVAARANYAKARVALDQVTGMTLEQHDIPLEYVIRGQS